METDLVMVADFLAYDSAGIIKINPTELLHLRLVATKHVLPYLIRNILDLLKNLEHPQSTVILLLDRPFFDIIKDHEPKIIN